jgi:hypothetical protein
MLFAVVAGAATHDGSARALTYAQLAKIQKRILSGYATLALSGESPSNAQRPDTYFPRGSDQCPNNLGSNVKVNQNCLNLTDPDLQGRAQAENETTAAVDPFDTNNLIAASNDYRGGDTHCFPAYSLDGGRTWNDTFVPTVFTRGTQFNARRQYWQTCGDPVVAGWDTKGNAYFIGLMFNRGQPPTSNSDLSSAIYAYRSTLNNGASWNFPGRPVIESSDLTGSGVPPFEDKEYGTVDNSTGSPFQDRVYVTWTEFTSEGTAYIYESYSADYGEHFSPRHLVSAESPLCTETFGLPTPNGKCNENQFSQPFVGPDGALYVVWANYNTPIFAGTDNRYQVLLAKSMDGGNTFTPPTKVSDFYDLPDCATYQAGKDFGRACVPEKGPTTNSYFRASNYPVGAVDPTNPAKVVVALASYINSSSNEANGCVPAGIDPATFQSLYTGVKTPGACNNGIVVSVSSDGGLTFTGTAADVRTLPQASQEPGQLTTDQWFQWAAFTKTGKFATSYYDRQYGDDELNGFSDVSLSGSGDLARYVVQRVTSRPMPPPTQFDGTFWGDYTGLAAWTNANPVWSDTRDPDLFLCPDTGTVTRPPAVCGGSADNAPAANDQNIYVANLPVPSK